MDKKIAEQMYHGEIPIEGTTNELLMLAMGACLEDDGNIVCLTCGQPNECCECGMYDEEGDCHE